ncbi:uncharacterized protein LOC126318605 [Schistocerca gregaria]|uniref:uncharacterized protein LOC126318605 n=1 Tax=Schistocerca gregaria TaxID=7010 RepID=UPI00211DD0D9|nr:uncharacterized protein LOC126318605 [Schistocerca gregaria]
MIDKDTEGNTFTEIQAEPNRIQGKKRFMRGSAGFKKQKPITSDFQSGLHGVLVTVDRCREHKAAREVLDLFNDVAEQHKPSNLEYSESSDLESQLYEEVRQLKEQKPQRFEVIDSGCKNLVFINFLDKNLDPIEFVHETLDYVINVTKEPRTRYTNRIIPIQKTCAASENSIAKTAVSLIELAFQRKTGEDEKSSGYKYMVELKSRNNNSIFKESIRDLLVSKMDPSHSVDLRHPDKIIMVEIFKKACGIAIIDSKMNNLYKRYNIRTITMNLKQSEVQIANSEGS